jgi:hypothetical protein
MKNLLLAFEFESVILANFEDLSKYNNLYGMEYVDFWPKILLLNLIGMRQGGFTSIIILGLDFVS